MVDFNLINSLGNLEDEVNTAVLTALGEEAAQEVEAADVAAFHGSGVSCRFADPAGNEKPGALARLPAPHPERPLDLRGYRLLHSGIGSSGLVSAHFSGHTTLRWPLRIWKVMPSAAFIPRASTL